MKTEFSPKIILVLGMHRSGTSLVAQLVSKWGAHVGNDLMPANTYNLDGYWEHNQLVTFHEKLLKITGNKWYAPSKEINTKQLLEEFGDEARRLVKDMDEGGDIWCWKDPRMTLFLDFWKEILIGREVIYILSNRPPKVIAASLFFRNKMPASIALVIWEYTVCNIFQALSVETNYKFVDYDKIVSNPDIYCRELFDYLNESCRLLKSKEICDVMVQSVKKTLNHSKSGMMLSLSPNHKKLLQIIEQGAIPADFKMSEDHLYMTREIFSLLSKYVLSNQHFPYAQLFHKNENGEYDENHSVIAETNKDLKTISFKFETPLYVNSLRLDPLNDYLNVRIFSIHLLNEGKLLDVPVTLSSNAISDDNKVFLFDTKDPQIFIDFDANNSIEISEVIVELDYLQTGIAAVPLIVYFKHQSIEQKQDWVAILLQLLQASESEKEPLNKTLIGTSDLLKTQEVQIGRISDKVVLLDQQVQNLEGMIIENNEKLSNSQLVIEELKNELNSSNEFHQKLEQKISELNPIISVLQNTNNEKLKSIDELNLRIDQFNAELFKIKSSLQFKISRLLLIPLLVFDPLRLMFLIRQKMTYFKNVKLIRQSGLFDQEYYLRHNPDVKASGINPARHYLLLGGFERRNPSEKFDSAFYLRQNPDVIESGMNPLVHFIRFGQKEGRLSISVTTVKSSTIQNNTLEADSYHEKEIQEISDSVNCVPELELLRGSEFFDAEYYLSVYQDIEVAGIDPAEHYFYVGWKEGRNPSSLFDTNYYLLLHDDVNKSGGNPLVHFLINGKTENRQIKSIISLEELKAQWKAKKYNQYDELSNAEILKFKGSASILFIGHDGGIGGGQMLLLSLIKWFYKNTGIDFKIILLTGGELVENYHAIAPTLVWDECKKHCPMNDDFSATIREFIGKIDLVYGNTMVSSIIYDELSYLNVPVITHVHELEKTIRMFESTDALKNMRHFTSLFLVASNPVAENLIHNHAIVPGKILMVPDFIEIRDLNFDSSKSELRKKLGLPKDGILVIGAGTITWRKGVDLFIETAIVLKQKGITDFHFIWIGDNGWEGDRRFYDICTWGELEQKIISKHVKNHITFLSVRENFYEYFLAGDIFFLSSREDPFPLVCLEAAQCSIPVICFENSGGMPGFVANDAGFVVPFEDVNVAAEKIMFLQNHQRRKTELGANAREKFLSGYTIDISAPKILDQCLKVGNFHPVVSVIVPNYNYAQFLDERLSSIYNQTFKEFEVIILDDASTDDSLKIIEKYRSKPNTSVVLNKVNSGTPFHQWQKGIEMAKGRIIWIAESDDFSDPHFLAMMLPFFNHREVALAHCNSNIIDDNNNITGDYTDYHQKLDFNHWKYDYRVKCTQEINFGLGVKNSILNVSSVLFRKEAIPTDIFSKLEAYRFSGDWLFYIELLKGRQIAYCHEKLNFHRRHSQTLTTQFNSDEQKKLTLLEEAAKIHTRVLELYELSTQFAEKWKFHIHEQIGAFYPNTKEEDFNKYYPFDVINNKIKELTAQAEAQKKRWVFITTNDGASMGGSEKLWIQAALETKQRGDEVMVVIKKWDPEPDFIDSLRKAGIEILFKKHFDFSQVVEFSPSLMIISIGDQDEGTEWYEHCQTSKIPYVILNQLTKEPVYWPVNEELIPKLIKGQEGAEIVLFTGKNNLRVMEKRLGHPITNSGIFYNPTGVERNIKVQYPKSGEVLNIAIVGNLHNIHKGQQLAIELFAKQKWRDRPVHLNIYGKGQDEDELKRQVYDLHLTNVTFRGYASELSEVWAQNHAIFLSSFMEGLPIVLMSAMLCTRVSIATDIGSHTEVISDNVSGFIAAKPTVDALDEALERAWQRKDDWEKMGMEARAAILKFLPEDPMRFFLNRIELFSMVNLRKEVPGNDQPLKPTKAIPAIK